ncbi:hypothetical protein [Yoonia sp.]|uniref:hypothetical protein n=1 Tax=Yoonia sp. TaxID=2212373 RepID=UPI002FDA6011
MKTTLTLTTAIAVAMLAGQASAQDLSYATGNLNGAMIQTDSDEFQSLTLSGAVELTYNQFLFGASGAYQTLDLGSQETFANYDGFVAYMPTAQLMVGAGLTGLTIDGSESYSGYEAFAQYRTGSFGTAILHERPLGNDDDFTVTTFYGEGSVTPEITIGGVVETVSDLDETVYYVSADYAAGPIFGRAYHVGISGVDATVFGARGSYDVNPNFFVSADLQLLDGFFGDNTTIYSLGGGYRISDSATIDAAFGQFITDSTDATMMRIGLTFEMGERKRLDTRMRNAIRTDFANGLGILQPDLGIGGGLNVY